MFKAGTDSLAVGDIIYSNIGGTEVAATGFYRSASSVYQTDSKGNGEIISIVQCS
jgi:hypothetical protein